jgi:DNA-dependent RNA polymerase auxiliary subunit epsilon
MNEENKNNENQQQNTQPADNGNNAGSKMFTQDDVNRIVSERLARDRESRSAQQQNDEKENELKARESRLDCREYVKDNNYPVELLDILDTSNIERFKEMVEKLSDLFCYKSARFVDPPLFTGPAGNRAQTGYDPIRNAFKQNT